MRRPALRSDAVLLVATEAGNSFANTNGDEMSENCRFYAAKMAELRLARQASHPLHNQVQELLDFVARLDAVWALEDRVGRKYMIPRRDATHYV